MNKPAWGATARERGERRPFGGESEDANVADGSGTASLSAASTGDGSRQGVPGPQAYIQWHADGTEWENANLPLSGGNICLGSWKVVDMKHVSRNHFGWLYTQGLLTGHFNETEMTTVGLNGTYTGVTDTKVYDLSGTLLAEVAGTSSAVRVSP